MPVSLYPPESVAESLSTDVPTTPPAVSLALVVIVGLALTVVNDSFTPLSIAPLFRPSPL